MTAPPHFWRRGFLKRHCQERPPQRFRHLSKIKFTFISAASPTPRSKDVGLCLSVANIAVHALWYRIYTIWKLGFFFSYYLLHFRCTAEVFKLPPRNHINKSCASALISILPTKWVHHPDASQGARHTRWGGRGGLCRPLIIYGVLRCYITE